MPTVRYTPRCIGDFWCLGVRVSTPIRLGKLKFWGSGRLASSGDSGRCWTGSGGPRLASADVRFSVFQVSPKAVVEDWIPKRRDSAPNRSLSLLNKFAPFSSSWKPFDRDISYFLRWCRNKDLRLARKTLAVTRVVKIVGRQPAAGIQSRSPGWFSFVSSWGACPIHGI